MATARPSLTIDREPAGQQEGFTILRLRNRAEQGMQTVEYAVGTAAAAGFAGCLTVLYPMCGSLIEDLYSRVVEVAFGSLPSLLAW